MPAARPANSKCIFRYYGVVLDGWRAAGHKVDFVGNAAFDFSAAAFRTSAGVTHVQAARAVVDARFTENDLPLHVPPKFSVEDNAKVTH